MAVRQSQVKLTVPPPPPGAVERRRLTGRLALSSGVSLTVVRGPAGCGKTEAVAAWARQAAPAPAWVRLDAGDREPRRFVEALRNALGLSAETVDGAVDEGDGEALVAAVTTAVAVGSDEVTLVLDGLEEISGGPAAPLFVALVRDLPVNLHLVVITTHPLPVPVGRLRLAGRLQEIDGAELRFTPEETIELVRSRLGSSMARDQARDLHEVTEGYVAAIIAAADALGPAEGGLPRQAWLREVFASVLQGLHPDQRQFVLETAPLRRMTPSLCDAVTGRRDSAVRLAELEEDALLLIRVDDRGPLYRYHRLLRDVLLEQLAAEDPERLAAAHRATAHWMETHGEPVVAVDEWLAAGEEQQAWALISRHHLETFLAGRQDVIERWAASLETQLGGVRPAEAIDRAVLALMLGRPDEANRWIEEADRALAPSTASESTRALVAVIRGLCHVLWGELDEALATFPHLSRDPAALPSGELGAVVALIEVQAQLGQFEAARQSFVAMGPSAPFEGALARVLVPGVQASLAALEGRLRDAVGVADAALAHAADVVGAEGIGTESSHWAVGLALLEQGQVTEAIPSLLTAERVARRTGLFHVVVRSAVALARARGLQGQTAAAFESLEAARRPIHVRPVPDRLRWWIDEAEARLLLLAGDGTEAALLLDELPHLAGPGVTVLRAWSARQAGDRAQAQDLLAPDLGPQASIGLRIEADLLRAACVRDPLLVRRHIRRAVHRGAPDGYLTVFLDHRAGVLDALRSLRTVEPSPYLTDLLFLLDAGEGRSVVESLTERELAVVDALRTTKSTDAIATELGVSLNTLKTHVKAVYRKLDATNRADAVRRAVVLRLIGPEAGGRGEAVIPRPGGGP